jgi:predicted hydrocarbon binding protein
MTTSNPIQIILNQNKPDQKMVGIDIIKSPMKYELLDLLRHDEMNFDEIVENTSKSKASVSMHLRDLREEGIVDYKADPTDNRKKIFYLKSDFLGSIDSNKIKKAQKDQTEILISDFEDNDEVDYTTLLTHIFKSLLMEYGMDMSPILQKLGNHIGEYIFNQLYDEDLEIFADNISSYWQKNKLGKLYFKMGAIIKVTCIDCFESRSMQKSGTPICNIEKGMLETLFNKFFKLDLNIEEIQCYAMGDEKCVFEIQP